MFITTCKYGLPIWLGIAMDASEKVQHRAMKLIPQLSNLPYKERLSILRKSSFSI